MKNIKNIPNYVKKMKNLFVINTPDPNIPFFERSENKIQWAVAEGKENLLTHIDVLQNGKILTMFSGEGAQEYCRDYIQDRIEAGLIGSENELEIRQSVYSADLKWVKCGSRAEAENFARENHYKLPVYKSY